jgi:Putative zinc-finger
MDHNEAVQQMATEKYLLGELPPELREAFEEHYFDCPECAMDLRAAATFVEEAKVHLPELAGPLAESSATRPAQVVATKKESRFSWWRPAFAGPVFATLLLIIGYQNFITFPALRATANEPLLSPTVYLHSGTRSIAPTPIEVDAKHGIALVVDRPQQPGYTKFLFELYDPQNKPVLAIPAPNDGQNADGTLSLAIPGADLHDGAYTLAISGLAANGDRTEIERHSLDFHLRN